jgi:hypothetical protein
MQPDILKALLPVVRALESLDIPYYIGGSVASSLYGMARSTLDIDIAARIERRHIGSLENNLQREYYLDKDMIVEAISTGSSFNLIHLETSIKVDVFVAGDEPYQKSAMDRKRKDRLVEGEPAIQFLVSSPEDVILSKLRWYELGGRVSERQWLDVTGVIKVQGEALDRDYLERWAENLGIAPLLQQAYADSGKEI